jgi:hypothetical protein
MIGLRALAATWLLYAAIMVTPAAAAPGNLVECRMPDGTIYVGPTPPAGCEPVTKDRDGRPRTDAEAGAHPSPTPSTSTPRD